MYLPGEWEQFLNSSFPVQEFYNQLEKFINGFETIIPSKNNIFNVFEFLNPQDVKCVLFGEDPYPRLASACGVAFWDKEINSWEDKTNGNSLKNILKSLLVQQGHASYSTKIDECRKIARLVDFKSPPKLFEHWLSQGVLLVNTAMTFSGNKDKKKHFNFWKDFHKTLIALLNKRENSPYYILWGNKAQAWEKEIVQTIDDPAKIIKQGHPTFIHQFMDKNNSTFSPFSEIITKTKISWY
jgi:uracil-DNA glycosylase